MPSSNGFATVQRNDVRVGVNYGKQFGGGAILTSSGVVVTCKHVIAGFNEGRIELGNGEQVEFVLLKEVEGKDIAFLVAKNPLNVDSVVFRQNATLHEGLDLVCYASVAQGPLCTVRGSLAYRPRPSSSGVLVAQIPLSPGTSGTGIFDLAGNFSAMCIGPVSEKETGFVRAWSADVIHDAIRDTFKDAWRIHLAQTDFDARTVRKNQSSIDLRVGDIVQSVNSYPINSDFEFILTGAVIAKRNEELTKLGVKRNGELVEISIRRDN